MVTQAPRRRAVALALLFCLSCLGLILFVWLGLGGSIPLQPKGYRFHVLFAEAGQLYPNSQVRIAGVNVGHVVSVRRRGVYSDATIELEPRFAPLRSDARALLRQKTLLGERFVALTPGTRRAPPVPDGGYLKRGQVMPTQPLDEVLNAFDAQTRERFRDVLLGASTTVAGAGAFELNSALGNAGPAAAQLDALVSTLDAQRGALRGLVRDTGTVLDAADRRQGDLRDLVVAGDRLFAATAAHDRALTRTVQALPPFLAELRSTLRAADHTAGILGPTLHTLRPVAPLVVPALRRLLTVSGPLQTLLRRFGPFLDTTIRTLPSATRFLDTSVPFMRRLFPAAQEVVPVIMYMSAYRRELMATITDSAASLEATAPSDLGVPLHYLRTLLPLNNESFVGAPQRLPTNRHNAYFAPGELDRLGHGGIRASDCRNTGNAATIPSFGGSGPPPCIVAPPWTFAGSGALFHRLAPAKP